MKDDLTDNLSAQAQSLLDNFKDYAVSHTKLAQIDKMLMRAVYEPAGFAHVLVYGPSGVGKTTMMNQITRRLNKEFPKVNGALNKSSDNSSLMPLLLLEARPSDGTTFNRADYYRTALKLLGESYYERRMLVDIEEEQTWQKKGRSRTKTAQFNDSPELRQALEDALVRRGVRAVILDEAQHLMKVGRGSSAGKLLDQLDWIKSMTNVTGVLHILIGTYELLSFRNLSAQASRRGLDLHFPRYLFQDEQERQDFQGVLLALLKQVPLQTDLEALMQHWFYFYERSIGCVGVLKDWFVRAVAAALQDGCDTLSWKRLEEHALSIAQCERMAIEALEGERKLGHSQSRREHLWQLLQTGMESISVLRALPLTGENSELVEAQQQSVSVETQSSLPKKTTRKTTKNSQASLQFEDLASVPKKPSGKKPTEIPEETETKAIKRTTRKKTSKSTSTEKAIESETKNTEQALPKKKSNRRVGQRAPQRDPVE
jgi:DNA polymerase III delta prime subunit